MENKYPRFLVIAIIMLGLAAGLQAAAQNPAPASKPAQKQPSAPAAAKAAPEPAADSPEKVVIKVADHKVTQGEIDFLISNLNPQGKQALASAGRRPLGEEYVKVLLLSHQAESEHLEATPEVRERIELQRTQMLAQAEYEKMSNDVKISPDEVGKYYSAHQPDYQTAQVREFVVIKKPEGAKENTPGFAAADAKAKADAIRKALTAGTDIKKITQDFVAANAVMIDADPRTIRRGQLLAPLDKSAFELKDGEISEPLETPQAIVFLQIVSHQTAEQKDVAADIENKIRQQKLEDEMADLRKKTDVWLDEDYFKGPSAPVPPAPPQAPAPPAAPKP
ncbi:MAG TPA: peptidylprolyl isomerase [Terriglobia bacterium]|nr:peptidylprolyl isomerase [Terriglobia bacterium]